MGVCVCPDYEAFVRKVWRAGNRYRRDFPWRHTFDPYEILVSEVMLQQTQVSRVLNFWQAFLDLFPSIDALAAADLSEVLALWQGLGYNRRAMYLHRCAQHCSKHFQGNLPLTYRQLRALPGIGPATAAGVVAFSQDKPVVYLETNVRSVFLHEFFPDSQKVNDRDIVALIRATCPEKYVRAWYFALLDWGAHLKAEGKNPSRSSVHYRKQSVFEGSIRQKRAEILRCVLAAGVISADSLRSALDDFERAGGRPAPSYELFERIVHTMQREGMLQKDERGYFVS